MFLRRKDGRLYRGDGKGRRGGKKIRKGNIEGYGKEIEEKNRG